MIYYVKETHIIGEFDSKEEAEYFLECIEKNVQPFNDGEAGLQVVRMLEATNEALRNHGGKVKL